MSAARPVRATAAATTTGILPRPPMTLRSTSPDSRACPLRLPHPAVSPPGEQRGGGPHRDVPGRRFRAPGGRHHRGTVGQQGFARYHQRAEQESLRPHRGLAQSPLAGRALSIRLRGRHLCYAGGSKKPVFAGSQGPKRHGRSSQRSTAAASWQPPSTLFNLLFQISKRI